jgi:hypothetical protein
MFGSFWRARRLWSFFGPRPDGENSTDDDFSTSWRPSGGRKSPLVDFSSLGDEVVFRPEPRTPGPGAAWSGGRL